MKRRLTFITSRKEKFREIQAMLSGIELVHQKADLPELQEIDAEKVIIDKLEAGFVHVPKGNFIVDDTSVFFDCLGGKLPGPLMKWFYKALGLQNIYEMTRDMRNNRATAVTIIGYAEPSGKLHIFKAKCEDSLCHHAETTILIGTRYSNRRGTKKHSVR